MKMGFIGFLVVGITLLSFVAGCELITEKNNKQPAQVVGKDLIIDEVFTLSPDKYYAYSWIELFNPTNRTIRWLDDAFPITAHVGGKSGALTRTEDDGRHWTDIYDGTEDINGVVFTYPDTGFIVGPNGFIKIIHHVNNTSWEYVDPVTNPVAGTTINLRAVAGQYISPTVYAVGDSGTIMRSITRGASWTKQATGTTRQLNSIWFESFTAVYVVGDSGLIMKSPRNNQWDKKTIGAAYASTNFYGVAFQALTGLAVGEGGTILQSKNAGDTWAAETSNVASNLRGVFYNRVFNRAFIVGDDGVILRSTDTAKTWQQQVSGTTASLRAVFFADSTHGFVVGTGGTVLYTSNGGRTWNQQESGTTADLTSISALPSVIRVRDRLVVEMYARRNTFFFDMSAPFVPGVNPNFDFIVSRDTGSVFFDPGQLRDLGVLPDPPPPVPPQGWVILNSDSLRFKDHTNVGPGKPYFQNFSISFTDTALFRARGVLWDLLDAGEIRLIRIFRKQLIATGENLGSSTAEVVDVVRYGGFRPNPATTPPNLLFPNNEPAGFIPEWSSLARYVNDAGGDVNVISTKPSFYMADRPIPGWYSQRSKP